MREKAEHALYVTHDGRTARDDTRPALPSAGSSADGSMVRPSLT
jgi:hypothetical protein